MVRAPLAPPCPPCCRAALVMRAFPIMANLANREGIGSALRAMAEDLVSERRRVLLLRRENQRLRAKLEAAGLTLDQSDVSLPELPEEGSENGGQNRLTCPHCGEPLPETQPEV